MNPKYNRSFITAALLFALHANPEQSEGAGPVMQHAEPEHEEGATEGNTGGVPAVTAKEGEILPPEAPKPVLDLPKGASISYADLGQKRAKAIAQLDERIATERQTLRDEVLTVLNGPKESHSTYVAGFTAEMAARESKNLDTRTLKNVKSQINRVLKAFIANPDAVKAALNDKSKRWDVMLKALPKQSNAGRPASAPAQPEAGKGGEMPSNLETATDVGAMVESLFAIAARCREVSKGKKAYYAEYMAVTALEALTHARGHFQTIYGKLSKDGVQPKDQEARKALELDREVK